MRLPFLNTHIVSVIGTMFDCLQRLHLDLVLSNVKHNTAEPICFDQLLKFVFAIERENYHGTMNIMYMYQVNK